METFLMILGCLLLAQFVLGIIVLLLYLIIIFKDAIVGFFGTLFASIVAWWNSISVWFIEAGESIVEFFESIGAFLGG